MLRIIYRLLSFCILFGSFLSAKAIDERYAARELSGNSLAPDSISTVLDEVYFNPQLKPLQTTWYVKNLITFQINEQYQNVLPDDFNATLKFKIRYTQDVNGTPVVSEMDPVTLRIEYAKLTPYQQKNVYINNNWYKVEIIIESILDDDGNVSPYRDALKLTNEILINREYNFSCTNNAVHAISDTLVKDKGELCVYWNQEKAADEYDLEWTYIDSTEVGAYQNNARKIFRNNATRVSITKEAYNIPLLYDSSGYLYFRVRAVQVKRNGQRIESAWSSDYSGGLGSYYFKGLDPQLNWQASTSFAEEGKRKSVVQYFDGSLKSRQTITKDNTTDTTIIAETLYDHQGRPVIQVMPAPSLSSILKYTPGFNRLNDPSSNEYAKLRYDSLLVDTCNCRLAAPAMDTSSGTANYYSPANPLATRDQHKYIPDANGYVFAETKFLPDNTGRVSAQGGVGETFKIGSKHETSYTYNKADQEELDALFGTEVGKASHYFKNTVQDANGQVSISYVDMHGRTIATALAGTPPVQVDALTSNQPNYMLKNLIDSNSNVIKGMVIENSNGLYVSKAGLHVFTYSLQPDSISIKTCDDTSRVCYDCVYDLRITITEECNDSTKNNKPPIVITQSNQVDTVCGTVNTFPNVTDSVYLQQGSYIVTKTLTINKKAMDYYREVFLAKNTCTSLEQTIQQQKTKLLSIIECTPSCESCKAGLGTLATFRQNYWQQLGISGTADTSNYLIQTQTAYNKQLAECNKLCENTGLHQSIREQMLADMTPPYGQYANPDSIDLFSMFAPKSDGPGYTKVAPYKDENGNEETVSPTGLSQEEFIKQFKSSWAEALLKEHPEYLKLQKYEQLAESNIWDEHFAATQTYQAAVDSGFLNPGDFSTRPSGTIYNYKSAHRDPFFTDLIANGNVDGSYKTRMADSLETKANDQNNDAVSMWSLATIMAHCPGERDNTCFDRYKSKDSAFAIGSDCSGDLDIAWQYFREMYLQEKREIMALVLNQAWQQHPYYQDSLLTLVNKGHTPNFIDPYLPMSETMANDSTGARDSLRLFINDNCAAYVTQWVSELESCYDSAARAWIIPRLIDVCREGGDENHLFGASTVKPSSTYQYKSFEEVIKAYRDSNGNPASYNSTCNVYLISAPVPYDQQPVYYDKPVYQKPDSCECATISTLYQKFENAGKDSTFSDYIYRTTGTRMYQGVLDTLRMACNGQINCSFLKDPLVLPPVLQCGGEKVCVGCNRVDSLYKKYITQFPDATPVVDTEDSVQLKKNQLFERFMNTSLGFTKQTADYLAFMDTCKIKIGNDTSLIRIRDEFINDYYNYGRKYDSDGCDTVTWNVTKGTGIINNTGVPHKNIFRNGFMQYPDTLVINNSEPKRVSYDFHYRDSACINGYVNIEYKMRDTVLPWEYWHRHEMEFYFGLDQGVTQGYYIVMNPLGTNGNYMSTIGAGSQNVFKTFLGLQQNENGTHTYNFEFADTLFNFYYDGQFIQSESFHVFNHEKLYGITVTSVATRNLSAQFDYVKCYDRNGKVFYFEDFTDSSKFKVFEPYIQCPRKPCTQAFTEYYNRQKQTSLNWSQIAGIYAAANVTLNICDTAGPTLCGKTEPVFPTAALTQHSTCDDIPLFSNSTGTLIYDAYRDSLISSFNDRYLAKCLSARYHESFTLYQPVSEFHYTLYYYDQAGNLVKTIPPAGVDVSKFAYARAWSDSVTAARSKKQFLTPQHKLPTQYRYNTLNQVVKQKSPDGGQSEFWYDRLGRLAISQNARQKPDSLYSYTRYDSLGRITEVGQINNSGHSAMNNSISRNQQTLEAWLTTLNNKRGQITNTIYDLPYPGFVGLGDPRMVITQRNLRNRVSYTTLTDTGTTNAYSQGTMYTYDILGNVDELLQDYGYSSVPNVMNQRGNRWKKIRYQYDLISGKVNMVMYQPGYRDAFFHRYSYDAENRLTLVETSRDSLVWEKDARYEYYRHGPLARVTLGEQQVQGLDYAYTLQGWLKGINSSGGVETFDMGEDGKVGSLNQYTARDAFGLTLNYFGNDYTAINGTPFPGYSSLLTDYRPLYNGNISSSSVYQKKFEGEVGGPLIFYNYKYDQLNRLTQQDAYEGQYNATTGVWTNLLSMNGRLKERIAYDANGNILKYLRNSIKTNQVDMDSLNYYYYANTNQLRRITDKVASNAFTDSENQIVDIDGQLDSNYVYDSIGNLISDKQEKITSIKWNVYGKIEEINRLATDTVPASNIKYTYDAMGNRISQVVTSNGTKHYTWYVRDAQGNILSTYSAQGNASLESLELQLADRFIYGSSRLGTIAVNDQDVDGGPGNTEYYYEDRAFGYDRGSKSYELTNHLGNVLATVSDKKYGVSSGGSSLIDHYEPHIVTAQDYYPFGMMSRVALSGKSYTFGFNGKMNDNDVKGGLGNQQDYGMRIYDGRVGRFLSTDPITKMYPELSPYQFSGNSPVQNIDLDGMEPLWSMNDHNQAMKEAAYAIWGPEKGERQYQISRQGQAAGAILGVTAWFDIAVTKGKISTFIMGTVLAGAAGHNREKTPEGRARQEKASRAAVADVIIGVGTGYIFGKTLQAGYLAYKETKGLFRAPLLNDPMTAEMKVPGVLPSYSKNPTLVVDEAIAGKVSAKSFTPQNGREFAISIENNAIKFADKNNKAGFYDYVIMESGELRVGNGHWTLSRGAKNVTAAGEVYIDDLGKISTITNNTGHYRLNQTELINAARTFKRNGVASNDLMVVDVTK